MSTRDTEHFDQKFVGSELPPGDLSGHSFEECSFENCDFKTTTLALAQFNSCQFISCDLSNVSLANARMRETSFRNCKLIGIQWVQLRDLVNPSYQDCNLSYCNFSGLKLKKSVFSMCSLKDADFSQAELSECDFRGAHLLNARFHGTSLLKADLRGAKDYLIDPISNKVRGARFSMPDAQGLLAGLGIVITN